ncbi:MAG: ATP-binding protein [Pseudomonadota bacterium]
MHGVADPGMLAALDTPLAATASRHVLLVEDTDDHAELVRLALASERPDWTLARVCSIAEAGAALAARPADVVLLDLGLRETRGLASLAAMLRIAAPVPVVALTADMDESHGTAAVAGGAEDFVAKAALAEAGIARTLDYAVARRLARDALLRKNRVLNAMISMLGHDMRGPATTVLAIVELLEMRHGETLGAEGRALLAEITGEIAKQLSSMGAGLQLARLGAAALRHEPLLLSDVMADATASFGVAEKARVSLRDDMALTVDRGLFPLALQNLVGNGLKYGDDAPAQVTVTASTSGTGQRIDVRDDGRGIPPERLADIMEPGVRARRFDTVSGHGFGLCIAREIVVAHGGRILVESAVGRGSVFSILLPGAEPVDRPP